MLHRVEIADALRLGLELAIEIVQSLFDVRRVRLVLGLLRFLFGQPRHGDLERARIVFCCFPLRELFREGATLRFENADHLRGLDVRPLAQLLLGVNGPPDDLVFHCVSERLFVATSARHEHLHDVRRHRGEIGAGEDGAKRFERLLFGFVGLERFETSGIVALCPEGRRDEHLFVKSRGAGAVYGQAGEREDPLSGMGGIGHHRDARELVLAERLRPKLREGPLRQLVLKVKLHGLRGERRRWLEAHRARRARRAPLPDWHLAGARGSEDVEDVAPRGVGAGDLFERRNIVRAGVIGPRRERRDAREMKAEIDDVAEPVGTKIEMIAGLLLEPVQIVELGLELAVAGQLELVTNGVGALTIRLRVSRGDLGDHLFRSLA